MDGLTVKQLSKIAGVSVRTLHYYDEIGLLKPSFIADNGYRYYQNSELLKLQQILFFRELEFSLEQIMNIMNNPKFNKTEALKDQRKLLLIKQKRLSKLVKTIDEALMKGGEKMKNDDLYNSFSKEEFDKLKEEAKQRWGDSEAYKQSEQRTKNWTQEDYKRIAKEGEEFTRSLAEMMPLGVQNEQVQQMIEKHHQGIEVFYDCSLQMYKGLGQLYIDDHRFSAYYERFAPGMAKFMKEAIDYYCQTHEEKN